MSLRFRSIATLVASLGMVAGSLLLAVPPATAGSNPVGTASGSPTTGLHGGTLITISGSGWAPNALLGIAECIRGASGSSQCDVAAASAVMTNSSGAIPAGTKFAAVTGAVGNGHCGTATTTANCDISVGYASNQQGVFFNVTFATPAQPKKTITCVKGKKSKKVTAVKPVCPAGYKLKK
jgi:Neocarzinostatin family